jgi:hypothetical protein
MSQLGSKPEVDIVRLLPHVRFVPWVTKMGDPGHSRLGIKLSTVGGRRPVPQQKETIMSEHDEKLDHRSPAEHQISGALDDKDLEKVAGGDKTVKVTHDDGSPKETVTFEYGSLQIRYTNQ